MGGMKTPVLVVLAILSLANATFAVDPPPDGGYPNNNTAEGQDALFDLTTGDNNTALGFNALLGFWNCNDAVVPALFLLRVR
jgi:hypothetical protein